jgi:hypothetical protein
MGQINAIRGSVGMLALLNTFVSQPGHECELTITLGYPIDTPDRLFLLFVIDDTKVALSIRETQWLADQLLHHSGSLGSLQGAFEGLGKAILHALSRAPVPTLH